MGRPSKRVIKTCQTCDNTFETKVSNVKRGGGKYCSRDCYRNRTTESKNYVTVNCKNCGKEFKTWMAWLRKGGGKHCSTICMAESYKKVEKRKVFACGNEFYFQRSRMDRGDVGKYCSLKCRDSGKSIIKNCVICNKRFKALVLYEGTDLEKKYCSLQCYWKSIEKEKVQFICKHCKKPFCVLKSYLKHKPASYCSNQCSSEAQKKRVSVKCDFCGKVFEKKECYSNGINYCSQLCKGKAQRSGTIRHCEYCGSEFYIRPSEIKKGAERSFKVGRFCSQECYKKSCEPTGLELEGKTILQEIGINFKEQVKIGSYIVDVFIPEKNVVIEWDGVYWHSLPDRVFSDKKKNNYLKSKGLRLLRFDEVEVYNYRKSVVEKIKELVC